MTSRWGHTAGCRAVMHRLCSFLVLVSLLVVTNGIGFDHEHVMECLNEAVNVDDLHVCSALNSVCVDANMCSVQESPLTPRGKQHDLAYAYPVITPLGTLSDTTTGVDKVREKARIPTEVANMIAGLREYMRYTYTEDHLPTTREPRQKWPDLRSYFQENIQALWFTCLAEEGEGPTKEELEIVMRQFLAEVNLCLVARHCALIPTERLPLFQSLEAAKQKGKGDKAAVREEFRRLMRLNKFDYAEEMEVPDLKDVPPRMVSRAVFSNALSTTVTTEFIASALSVVASAVSTIFASVSAHNARTESQQGTTHARLEAAHGLTMSTGSLIANAPASIVKQRVLKMANGALAMCAAGNSKLKKKIRENIKTDTEKKKRDDGLKRFRQLLQVGKFSKELWMRKLAGAASGSKSPSSVDDLRERPDVKRQDQNIRDVTQGDSSGKRLQPAQRN